MTGAKGRNPFAWDDPFLLEAQLNEEERMIRDSARAYAQDSCAACHRGLPRGEDGPGDLPRDGRRLGSWA